MAQQAFNVLDPKDYRQAILDGVSGKAQVDIDDLAHKLHVEHPGFVHTHFSTAVDELVKAEKIRREAFLLFPVKK